VLNGVVTTNVCHLLSTFVLFRLASLLDSTQLHNKRVAFVTSILHILSPAGVFLLAPYSEAPFAFLNFLASYFYAKAILERSRQNSRIWSDIYILAAGFLFGLATMVRSNGLFAGIIFACDAAIWIVSSVVTVKQVAFTNYRLLPSLWSTILAGSMVGAGFAIPQITAYREFCMGGLPSDQPPWCTAMPPSITTYIQSKYWNVGLFKYWTVSNLPLFLLAIPMLYVLFVTGIKPFQQSRTKSQSDKISSFLLSRFVLPQLAVAVLTLTTAHVQIINRLSSGYPVWYIYLAVAVTSTNKKELGWAKIAVQLMVMYAIIQAALFSAFLPPA
jgi:phosphatidylinositol glycan class V